MTDKMNIIFDGFVIYFLGQRIEFICLYIPQRHFFISTLWLKTTNFLIGAKVHLRKNTLVNGTVWFYAFPTVQ